MAEVSQIRVRGTLYDIKDTVARRGSGSSPAVASTAAGMIDTSKIYVYTGSETGYTAGNWYYYDGTSWVSGGIYQSSGIETDTTLAVSGAAADSKATGDAINNIVYVGTEVQDSHTQMLVSPTTSELEIVTKTEFDTELSELKSQIDSIEEEIEGGTGSGLTTAQWRNMISLFRAAVYDTSVLANPQTVVDELEDSYDNIPSTSITLSQSGLTFLTADTQSVTATLRPNTTTDSISAVSSNPSVASVSVNNRVVTVTPVSNGSVTITVTTQSGISATFSVVVDMPQTFSITNALTGCTNSNQQAVITEGSSYEGTLVFADSSYRLSSIEVLMGFDDITETAWDSETNTISISNVTGDISITATAVTPVLYSLAQPLVTSGEASNFVNTNVKIGQTDTSFTVIAYITTTVAASALGSNKFIISARDASNNCFGFMVRTTNYCITINDINKTGTPANYNNIQNYKIVVRHTAGELDIKGALKCFDQQNASATNRTFTGTTTFTEFVSHSNPIYLGKRIDGYGVCSNITIETFKVLNYVLTDDEVNAYLATESAEV